MPKVIRRDEITCDVYEGDCIEVLTTLPSDSVHCCVTSPPYWGLRDYGHARQIGLEGTPEAYVARMVEVFREVRRCLRDDGTLWLNLGDSYATNGGAHGGRDDNQRGVGGKRTHEAGAGDREPRRAPLGLKPKDLVGIPWMLAFALRADGWYLRQDIIWHKPNPMPESVRDRCTKAHEYIFLLSKSERYFFDSEAMRENSVDPVGSAKRYNAPFFVGAKHESGGYSANGAKHTGGMKVFDGKRNRRSVWTVATRPYKGAHFATFPPALIEPCILAGCPEGGTVLDPFSGSGTTGVVALNKGRSYIGIELNPDYVRMSCERITNSKCDTRS